MNQDAASSFESSFLARPLAKQIEDCHSYELAPLFLEVFANCRNVLEAGCGSGRWCGWLQAHGIAADGIDWSAALCERAARELPGSRFFACDMGDSGLPDDSYDGLLALGSVEHTSGGPGRALKEFYRVLRPNGVGVITVPNGGWLRIAMNALTDPFQRLKGAPIIRKLAGKAPLARDARSWAEAHIGTVANWHPRMALSPGGWSFYEYAFNSAQMEAFLAEAGFAVERRFTAFIDEGVLHSFGRVAGKWNASEARVDLTFAGRILKRALPDSVAGHMLCYVVRKPAPTHSKRE